MRILGTDALFHAPAAPPVDGRTVAAAEEDGLLAIGPRAVRGGRASG
ncbi:hypothetical protein ACH4VX_25055 [Streptomyces sp. NPDC020731]